MIYCEERDGHDVWVFVDELRTPRGDSYVESGEFVAAFRFDAEPNGIVTGEFLQSGTTLRRFKRPDEAASAAFTEAFGRIASAKGP